MESNKATAASPLLTKDDEDKTKKRLVTGIALSVSFTVTLALSVPCLQLLVPSSVQSLELLFWAFMVHLITAVPFWFIFWDRLKTLERNQVPWLVVTGLCNAFSTAWFYMASESLPSGVVGAVGQGTMLIFSVLAYAVLDRYVNKLVIVATVLCVVGLGLYMASTVYFDPATVTVTTATNTSAQPQLVSRALFSLALQKIHPSLPYIILTSSSLLMVIANAILNRKFGDLSLIKLLVFFPIIGVIVAMVTMFMFSTPTWGLQEHSGEKIFSLICFLLLFHVSNICLYAAWICTSAPVFSIIASGGIVLLIITQYLIPVPGIEAGIPDPCEICGALLIVLANIIGPLGELTANPCRRCNKEA